MPLQQAHAGQPLHATVESEEPIATGFVALHAEQAIGKVSRAALECIGSRAHGSGRFQGNGGVRGQRPQGLDDVAAIALLRTAQRPRHLDEYRIADPDTDVGLGRIVEDASRLGRR